MQQVIQYAYVVITWLLTKIIMGGIVAPVNVYHPIEILIGKKSIVNVRNSMEIKNDPQLNNILDNFALASSIHNTIHKTLLDLPPLVAKFPLDKRDLRKAITMNFLETLSQERDDILESAIYSYKLYKELQAKQNVSANTESSINIPKI